MDTTAPAQRRPFVGWAFLAILGGAMLLTVGGIALAAIISHNQQAVPYRPNSPEGTAQRYLHLLQSGKVDAAYAMTRMPAFGSGLMSRSEFHQHFDSWSQSSHQVSLESTTVSHADASVTVTISSFSGGPLGASTGSNRATLTLTREQHRWLITGPPYLPGS